MARSCGPAHNRDAVVFEQEMMDGLTTMSLLDTFTGEALSGPLHEAEVTLPQVSVVASRRSFWFAWSRFHPDTALWSAEVGR
ncbi:MAG: DUF3179 domain-containing protein [Intrasporangiaceae bacterium]|nr:DUF3179 domain-containing protein [Intrasporangiaceae bacterium]